jgi:uncharacterized protein YjbJ (UPF0337 family)
MTFLKIKCILKNKTKPIMIKKIVVPALFILSIALISCSGKKETPASIAQKWCEMNGKAHKAEGAAKEAAEKALGEYEKKIESKHDEAFMKQVGAEVEKCEDASEGRQ